MSESYRDKPCPHCGQFTNRGVSIDAVIIKDGKILLVKRGVEPNKGFWGTPGGYVLWDQSVEDSVAREVREETGLTVTSTKLVGVYSARDRHPKQVINIVYLVKTTDGTPVAGTDADDVRWFPLDALPEPLALDHKQNIIDARKLLESK